MRICAGCGSEFVLGSRPQKTYCTPKCRNAAYQRAHLDRSRISNRKSYHLHRAARLAARDTPEKKARHSAYCRAYRLANYETLAASQRAYHLRIAEKRLAYMREYNSRIETKERRNEHRSKNLTRVRECYAAYREKNRAKFREYSIRNAHKRRAAMQMAPREPISRLAVFQRDHWRCQLCGERTPRKLLGTNEPKAPTLDHIVPLSVGGAHLYSNVQLACWTCNCSKRNKLRGQFRLF